MIYLVRHGQTVFNVEGRYQGWSDSALTALGRDQARGHGPRLAPVVQTGQIWTSPLPRAAETARLLAAALPGLALQEDARLRELSLGECDGLTRAEIGALCPGLRKAHPPGEWIFHTPGGEGLAAITARLAGVLGDAAAAPGDVVLVSHGISGRLLRGMHTGLPLGQALALEAPQDVVFRLLPGGGIDQLGQGG